MNKACWATVKVTAAVHNVRLGGQTAPGIADVIDTPFVALDEDPGVYTMEACPNASVTADAGEIVPPLTSVSVKLTVWFLTRLLAASRTVAVIVLIWVAEPPPALTPIVAGSACRVMEFGVVATNSKFSCVVRLLVVAVITAYPAFVDDTDTVAKPPPAVTALDALKVPLVAVKLTVTPSTPTPLFSNWTVTGCDAPRLTSVFAAGDEKVNEFAVTVMFWVAVVPAPVAVTLPGSLTPVTVTVA